MFSRIDFDRDHKGYCSRLKRLSRGLFCFAIFETMHVSDWSEGGGVEPLHLVLFSSNNNNNLIIIIIIIIVIIIVIIIIIIIVIAIIIK